MALCITVILSLLVSCLTIHYQLLVQWCYYFAFPPREINFKQVLWLIVLNNQSLTETFYPLILALFLTHM